MGLRDRWHGMLVYFGLAEDETWYEDDDEDGSAANEDLQRTYRERPNVRRIDQRRGRGSADIDDIFSEEPTPRRPPRGGRKSDPHGATGHLLLIAHGFEMKMLPGLVHEGLAQATVGESVKTGGKAVEIVRFWITDAGRRAIGE